MKILLPIVILLFGQDVFAQLVFDQGKPMIYANDKNAYWSKTKSVSYLGETRINEITLNRNATFACWSRPDVSCFTWQQFKGNWQRIKDTIVFADSYEVLENDTRVSYQQDARESIFITFQTDKHSVLKNKAIAIKLIYDHAAHLEDSGVIYSMTAENTLTLPFTNIPNRNQLSAIRIEYKLNFFERRFAYLAENKTINIRRGEIPNIMHVVFVEKPQKEIVSRIIKAVIQNDKLTIFSTTKTKTTLPDYHRDMKFEDIYTLVK